MNREQPFFLNQHLQASSRINTHAQSHLYAEVKENKKKEKEKEKIKRKRMKKNKYFTKG